jgi:hypothetical protein
VTSHTVSVKQQKKGRDSLQPIGSVNATIHGGTTDELRTTDELLMVQ